MLNQLTNKFQLLVTLLIIIPISALVAYSNGGYYFAIYINIVQLFVILISRGIWLSDKSNFYIRSAVLAIVSVVVAYQNSWLQTIVQVFINKYYPNIALPDNSVSPFLLLFLLALVAVVFYFTQEKLALISEISQKPTLTLTKQELDDFCLKLKNYIKDIDTETAWEPENYIRLEAEVIVKSDYGQEKRIDDLIKSVRSSKHKLFLFTGDPGSGKSVAMRKLCLDLLAEAPKSNIIPIYVNLKNWDFEGKPTEDSLREFVKNEINKSKDSDLSVFLDTKFKELKKNGNLFFILDSFDEIPAILSATEGQQIIEDITKVCRDFLTVSHDNTKGILASRLYRKPKIEYFRASTTFEAIPFTEKKIIQALNNVGITDENKIKQLFKDNRNLIGVMRRPLVLALATDYLKKHIDRSDNLTQSKIFSVYFEEKINLATTLLGYNIKSEDVITITQQIAHTIFKEGKLQADMIFLKQNINDARLEKVIAILKKANIARNENSPIFSFSHRRFYEYFKVQQMLVHPEQNPNPEQNIPTDSLWRDSLVLYCEVAPLEEAKKIANYCWSVINQNKDLSNLATKHCIRFLAEAFTNKNEAIKDFEADLFELLNDTIITNKNILDVKIASEAIGILSDDYLSEATINSLKLNDAWINETAIRGCRHLSELDEKLELSILNSIFYLSGLLLINNIKIKKLEEFIYSFSLSNAFKEPKIKLEWYVFSIKLFKFFLPILCISISFHFFIFDIHTFYDSIAYTIGIYFSIYVISKRYYLDKSKNIDKNELNFHIMLMLFLLFCGIFLKNTDVLEIFELLSTLIIYANISKLSYIVFFIIGVAFIVYIKYAIKDYTINELKENFLYVITEVFYIIIVIFCIAIFCITIFCITKYCTLFLEESFFFETKYRIELKEVFQYLSLIFSIITIMLFLYFLIKNRVNKNRIKNFIKNRVNRQNIENLILETEQSLYRWKIIISELDQKVTEVTGNYSEGFLRAGISPARTALAQLEERWIKNQEDKAEEAKRLALEMEQKIQNHTFNQTTLLDLLKDNKIEDVFNVINQSEQKHDNAIVSLSNRYNKLQDDISKGKILQENKNVEQNQIIDGLTNWIKTNFSK